MINSARVSGRVDPQIRNEAVAILKPYGLTLSAYIRLVYEHVAREKKLPPGFVMPDETKRTRREA